MSQLATEFGHILPRSLSQYYSASPGVPASGILKLSDFYGKYKELPPIEAYLFDNTTQANAFTTTHAPATQQQVFNTWGRFSNNVWFPSGTPPTGEAASWAYDAQTERISSTINSNTRVGFVSTELLDDFEFEATMASTNADDDAIGLVAAHHNDGTNNTILMVSRWNYNVNNWIFTVLSNNVFTNIVNGSNPATIGFQNPNAQGWAASGPTRIRIKRQGNIVSAWCSPFGSTDIDIGTLMQVDLSAQPSTLPLIGKRAYGYMAYSQASATFYDTVLIGGLASDTVFNSATGAVLKYNGSSWVNTGESIAAKLGYPRQVTNPDTGIVFRIDPYGNISRV